MNGVKFIFLIYLFCWKQLPAQTVVNGIVVDGNSFEPMENVTVSIEASTFKTQTDSLGYFIFNDLDHLSGEQIFVFSTPGYAILRLPVIITNGETKNLDFVTLKMDMFREQTLAGIVSLSDNELNDDEGSIENVSGLLQASRDVFLNAAAFDFSSTFYKPRGLDSDQGTLLINGIEMNKIFNGRPQWGNWGGLNDVQRNQIFSMGLSPSEVAFGGLAGTTNIVMRAAEFSKGGRISYAAANRSYTGRVMGTYNSGEMLSGWSYSVSASRRFAEEGYNDGSLYDANALFISVGKKLNNRHSINFTGFYTPNIRGKSSANTEEVIELKGRRYNSFWGYQNGEIRNSRVREIKEPVLMLNHYWKLSDKMEFNTNLATQFGTISNSRIDFGGTRIGTGPLGQQSFIGGGSNPDPAYYQNLPSYFLRFDYNRNYEAAYVAMQDLENKGQINWQDLYFENAITSNEGGNSIYIIAEDVNEDTQFWLNSIATYRVNESILLNAKVRHNRLKSENYGRIKDLLGGSGYLDVDFFAEGDEVTPVSDRAQSDLQNRNNIATEGEKFKYNFELRADVNEGFLQAQVKNKIVDYYFAGNLSSTSYQRVGLFQNGNFPNTSMGESQKLKFLNYGLKGGATFKITGKHLLDLNLGILTRPPTLRNSFTNSRQNNDVVTDLGNEKFNSIDAGYIFRSSLLKLRLTGYFTQIGDATEIAYYYADGLAGLGRNQSTAFVQEVLTGIDKQHLGVEFGAESQITNTIKLKAAAGIGQYVYNNNPRLYLTSEDFPEPVDYGSAYLKNYRIAGGPQQAAQVGFEYRDPGFWWFGTTVNFFSHAFADVSPLTRTSNFRTDADGFPILNYDEKVARNLLKQEQFEDYVLVNAIGGKSWLLNDGYFLGFFVSLNNIFDVFYKSGGFEQSRNANYNTLKEDKMREQPLFGPRYWIGNGATYYANIYFRF